MRNGGALSPHKPHGIFPNMSETSNTNNTNQDMFRPATEQVAPTARATGTRAIMKRLTATAATVANEVRTTSQKLEKAVAPEVPELVNALTELRDALAEGRPTRGTSTRAELVRGGTPKLTLVVVGDCSPSMETEIHQWAQGRLKGVEAEDKLVALLGSAAMQMSTGQYGEFDTEFMLFSLPPSAKGDNLLQENGQIPGKAKSADPYNISKVIKPREQVFREEDLAGVFAFLRDGEYRGSGTFVVPALELLQEELRDNRQWAERIKSHEEAVVVLLVTDGDVFDSGEAKTLINGKNALAENGVYVMSAVIGGGGDLIKQATGRHTFGANSPEEFVKGVRQQAEIARSERGGRSFRTR